MALRCVNTRCRTAHAAAQPFETLTHTRNTHTRSKLTLPFLIALAFYLSAARQSTEQEMQIGLTSTQISAALANRHDPYTPWVCTSGYRPTEQLRLSLKHIHHQAQVMRCILTLLFTRRPARVCRKHMASCLRGPLRGGSHSAQATQPADDVSATLMLLQARLPGCPSCMQGQQLHAGAMQNDLGHCAGRACLLGLVCIPDRACAGAPSALTTPRQPAGAPLEALVALRQLVQVP